MKELKTAKIKKYDVKGTLAAFLACAICTMIMGIIVFLGFSDLNKRKAETREEIRFDEIEDIEESEDAWFIVSTDGNIYEIGK